MANNSFVIVGKLGIGKESDKFKPFQKSNNGRGWNSQRLSFYVKNDINFQNLEISGGYSETKPVVYSFSKGSEGKKGEPMQIPWTDRKNKDVIEKVAEFRKNVIIFDEENRMEFISAYDFAEAVHNIIKDDKYKDCLWRIQGDVVTNEWNGKFYTKFVPTRMYKVSAEEEHISEGVLEFHFGEDCIDDQYETLNKLFIKGYTREYDGTRKKEIGIPLEPIEVSFANVKPEIRQKVYEKYKQLFTVDGENFKKIGLKVNYLSGAEDVEFTEDMLDDEQKEMIELGFITFEEVKKEMGSGKSNYDSVTRVTGLARGYSKGAIETEFTIKDYVLSEDNNNDLDSEIDSLFDL